MELNSVTANYKQTFPYEKGQKYFFNTRRKQGVIGIIINFLTPYEICFLLNLCKNFFFNISRQLKIKVIIFNLGY